MSNFPILSLAAALTITTGCSSTLDPLTKSPFGDEGTDCEDTETDDGTETDTEDTLTDTETGTEIDDNCAFMVDTWDGEVEMGNTLSITLNDSSGTAEPGRVDVLTVNFTADDPNCADLLITSFGVKGIWTDGAGGFDEDGLPYYGWMPTWVGASINDEIVAGVIPTIPTGHAAYATLAYPFIVRAGETVTVTIPANLNGASAELDDSVMFNVIGNSITVYDGESDPRVLMGEDIFGDMIVF